VFQNAILALIMFLLLSSVATD